MACVPHATRQGEEGGSSVHLGTGSLHASSRCQCCSSWPSCPTTKKGQEFVNSNHHVLWVWVSVQHAHLPVPLQSVSTTTGFAVWSYSPTSGTPLVAGMAPGRPHLFALRSIKGSCSQVQPGHWLLHPHCQRSVHAWVELCHSIWPSHPRVSA